MMQPLAGMEPQTLTQLDEDLITATYKGNLELMQKLIAAGADVNAALAAPLRNASYFQREDACKLLLAYNADISLADGLGETALHVAAKKIEDPTIPYDVEIKGRNVETRDAAALAEARAEIKRLYEMSRIKGEAICALILNHQKQTNYAIKTTLLCLHRLRHNADKNSKITACAGELYRQFKTLLLPHMGNYASINQLLNKRNNLGKRAYDECQLDCLRPDDNSEKNEPEPKQEKPDSVLTCSIQ